MVAGREQFPSVEATTWSHECIQLNATVFGSAWCCRDSLRYLHWPLRALVALNLVTETLETEVKDVVLLEGLVSLRAVPIPL